MSTMDPFNEAELLKGAQAFNMDALTAIYDHLSPNLFAYASRLLGNSVLAEDCVAETFSRFLHVLKKGKGPLHHLRAYLYRIAHNWITDYFRQKHEEQPGDEELEKSMGPASITNQAEGAIPREAILNALYRLSADQRQVITLRYLEGWDHAEIATSLGKNINTVKVIQHRAVHKLRKYFSPKDL